VSFAGLLRVDGGIIRHAATAFGAVAGTILRRPDIDGILIGRTIEEARKIRGDYTSPRWTKPSSPSAAESRRNTARRY
jgi:xanthine dehydrogenase iron-sulfur cluster and FAD-binding subunit A